MNVPQPQFERRAVRGVDSAAVEWGANCGPAAIAGALGLDMPDVREFVAPSGRFRGWMGVRDFKDALRRAGAEILEELHKPETRRFAELARVCDRQLGPYAVPGAPSIVLLRWHGPWDQIPNESRRAKVQATKRHAVCYRHAYHGPLSHFGQANGPGWVLDVNNDGGAPDTARWLPTFFWLRTVAPRLVPKRGSGEFSVDWFAVVNARGN